MMAGMKSNMICCAGFICLRSEAVNGTTRMQPTIDAPARAAAYDQGNRGYTGTNSGGGKSSKAGVRSESISSSPVDGGGYPVVSFSRSRSNSLYI